MESTPAHGDCKYRYQAELIRVIDGDTIVARVDLGFHVFTEQILRLHGINAVELRGEHRQLGLEAAEHLKALINIHSPLTIKTIKDRTGKYGRYLVVLYGEDDLDLNLQMVHDGHAVVTD